MKVDVVVAVQSWPSVVVLVEVVVDVVVVEATYVEDVRVVLVNVVVDIVDCVDVTVSTLIVNGTDAELVFVTAS